MLNEATFTLDVERIHVIELSHILCNPVEHKEKTSMNKTRINLFALAQRLDALKRSARTREVGRSEDEFNHKRSASVAHVLVACANDNELLAMHADNLEHARNSRGRFDTNGEFPVCDYLYNDMLTENEVVLEACDNESLGGLLTQAKFWREVFIGVSLLTLLALMGLLLVTLAPQAVY